ncbi:BspA family leucine-rich repeat surface protein [Enterococcus raffinosus]|uniref:BspA family leucine-rich repeat surface protein n=1 Tax=Enterococcus raffinosus TaxID=71452 RepID=A0AAW8TA53_9ENTE|nr:BspA family leucine-rich repeat surface protein [Enterococcus raffinosus]MDT2523253.1 BspA family leucine-rich repeat surface protein [Enterococcus raffinosus]MDT2531271.1 BspA family leucine-rich repeat surface protein [Enterococcus raffinosus]MDT2533927.1 BspA family leucine-rich repeat surface protein [Enterococcus raffinosus]MDT2544730.1 BspA family leucine-rich repeat surface protein [Enterococcus raffinosus]MDT2556002.1 BspA family leucine-rich repeat surface protein [Enterococcus raf
MNNKKDNLLIGLIVGILLLSIIPFRLSYAETKNSEETVESSSSSLEKVNNIDTTEIIESSSAVADSEISASETSTEHLSESSSSSDKTEQSTDNSSQKNTLDTTSKEQIEDKDKSKTSIPTLAELENSWDLEEVIDADGYYILLKKYKEKASADVVIPGAVMDGPMVWPIKIQFVDQDKNNTSNPEKSVWKYRFNADPQGKPIANITSVTAQEVMGYKPKVKGTIMDFAFSVGSSVHPDNNQHQSFPEMKKLDLQYLDVSDVTSMNYLATYMSNLESINVKNWDVRKVTGLSRGFYRNNNLSELIGLETWDLAAIKDLSYFLSLDWSLRKDSVAPIQNWFTNSAPPLTDISYMLWNISNFDGTLSLITDGWLEASKSIKNMQGAFGGMTSVETIDLTGWMPNNVVNTSELFQSNKKLNRLLGTEEWTCEQLEYTKWMFAGTNLEIINLTKLNPVQLETNTFYPNSFVGDKDPTPKKLLVINDQSTVVKNYDYKNDFRIKMDYPYLDSNNGVFFNKDTKKLFIEMK